MKMTHQDCPVEPRGFIYEVLGAIRCTSCNLFRVLPITRRRNGKNDAK